LTKWQRWSFKLSAENATNTSDAKVNLLSKNYEAIAISYENNFKEFMSTITIPEWGVKKSRVRIQTL
jgi:hypothetical protein